jgi:hypothetical protein
MIDNPLTPLTMNSSPSISNYENLGLYLTSSQTSKSASERNGRAIRRVFRKPTPTPITTLDWNVEECNIQLRNENGSVREVSGYLVCRDEISKRFVNMESVQRFISQN